MPKNENYVSLSRAALMLDASAMTLKRWYIWYESPRYEHPSDLKLPEYFYFDKRGTKFFKVSDLPMLREFQTKVQTTHRGCMAQYNADVAWGKRGARFKRSRFRQPREPGEYAPKNTHDPTNISKELDKKEEMKWQAEQEKERKRREGLENL